MSNVTNSQNNISTNIQNISYSSFLQPNTISEGIYDLEYSYGPNEQRIKSVLKQNNFEVQSKLYFDGYEKVMIYGTSPFYLHYIAAGDNLVAIVKRTLVSTDTLLCTSAY
ncbi:MAG: hypothetical protein R2771_15665 [Saprospiraceae bacterium]